MRTFSNFIAILAGFSLFAAPLHDSYAGGSKGSSSSGGSHSSGTSHSSGSSNSGSRSSPSSSGSGGGYSKPSSTSSPSSGSHSSSPGSSGTSHNSPNSSSSSKPASTTPSTHPTTTHTSPSTTNSTQSSQGYSKPGNTATTTNNNSTHKSSSTGSSTLGAASTHNMSADSLKAYQAERSTATRPPMPVTKQEATNNPARSVYKNTDSYMQNRTTVVKNYYNNHPGISGMNYGMRPNYGIFDSNFLTGMIMGYVGSNLINNSMWMYSHRNEPWYQSYRSDLNAQAANNAELQAKVAAMDAEIAKLQAANAVPQSKNTLPENVDPALAIAPEAMIAADEHNEGMSWGWALGFFSFGLALAFITIRLFK